MEKVRLPFLMRRKLELSRGQQYVSLFFWVFMIINTFMLNLREYMVLDIWIYIVISVVGGGAIIFIVWFLGFIDLKKKLFYNERKYAGEEDPVMNETLENTRLILMRLE